ncbi:MAG TPA: hypothetical protein VIX19_09455 [Terriglobales bacterium]
MALSKENRFSLTATHHRRIHKLVSAWAILVLVVSIAANAQMQRMNVPTQSSFRGLSVVSQRVVWASGTEGTVIRTLDEGNHWSVMRVSGAESLDFRGIKAFDDKTAVIISSGPAEKGQARIYRTSDGGATWKQVYEDKRVGIFFDAVAFWDQNHGMVLSDPVDGKFALFTTHDGGATWKQLPPSALPQALPNEGAFAASNSCLTVYGDSYVWFATGGASVARVFRSRDRGKSWGVSETPVHPANPSSGIFSLAFHDPKRGVAVGGDYQRPAGSDMPNVITTIDGGQTWRIGGPTNPPGIYLSSVIFEKDSGWLKPSHTGALLAGGPAGVLQALPGDLWRRRSTSNVNALAYPAAGRIWTVGPGGAVFRENPRTQR